MPVELEPIVALIAANRYQEALSLLITHVLSLRY